MPRKKEMSKGELISSEKERLIKIYADVDERKRDTLAGLIEECAFMRVTLKELREAIDAHGVIDEMQQGSYSIQRESPYVKTYHAMIQRYTTANEKLLSMLPKDNRPTEIEDGFEKFVGGREDD